MVRQMLAGRAIDNDSGYGVPGSARCAHGPRVWALARCLCAADAHLVDDDRRWSTAGRASVEGDVVSVPALADQRRCNAVLALEAAMAQRGGVRSWAGCQPLSRWRSVLDRARQHLGDHGGVQFGAVAAGAYGQ